jgi:hypothetical protein
VYFWRQGARWPLLVLAVALLVLWVPRDLFQWLSQHDLAPRTFGAFQLPALLAVYGLGLACLGARSERGAPAPGVER